MTTNLIINRFVSNTFLISLIIISILIVANLFIGSYLRNTLEVILWYADDVVYISAAHNFRETKNFEINYLPYDFFEHNSIDDLTKSYPTISHTFGSWGPLYFVLLGSFYQLLGTTPNSLYFHGSTFNNILSSIFLVMFFFFIRNKFNLKIAIFSSLLVLFMPIFASMSARVVPYQLLFIFSLAGLFFLEKKKTHYIIFGVFAGLAHLTHPFGIFMGISYGLFLLVNREFRGFLITTGIWHLLLLPWFLRNYYFFKDIGWGLSIPLSRNVSDLFTLLLNPESRISGAITNLIIKDFSETFLPFQIFANTFPQELSTIYHMDYLIIFLIIFTGFAFFKINKLKITLKYLALLILGVSYIVAYYLEDIYLQIAIIFIIPLILVYFLYRYRKEIFENPIPRIYSFIILFTFISLIGFYYQSYLHGGHTPDTKQITFMFILLIPLSILGLEKIMKQIMSKKYPTLKVLPIIIMGLVISPIMIQMTYGLVSTNDYFKNHDTVPGFILNPNDYPLLAEHLDLLNKWIQSTGTKDPIASNFPEATFLKTGLSSIPLPPHTVSANDFDHFVDHYNISYLVFYDIPYTDPEKYNLKQFESESLYDGLAFLTTSNYYYPTIYTVGNSHIVRVGNIMDSDISYPIAYLLKARKLEINNNFNESSKIYDELSYYKSDLTRMGEIICNSLTEFNKYGADIRTCTDVFEKYPNSMMDLNGMVTIYRLHTVSPDLISTEKITEIENLLVNKTLITESQKILQYLDSVPIGKSIPVYDLIIKQSPAVIRQLIESEQYDKALDDFDILIQIYEKKLNTLNSVERIEMQKNMIHVMHGQATLLMNIGQFSKAEDVYSKIISIDQFNLAAWKQKAALLEKSDRLDQAIYSYEFMLKLEEDHTETLKKIDELKNKLTNQQNN